MVANVFTPATDHRQFVLYCVLLIIRLGYMTRQWGLLLGWKWEETLSDLPLIKSTESLPHQNSAQILCNGEVWVDKSAIRVYAAQIPESK